MEQNDSELIAFGKLSESEVDGIVAGLKGTDGQIQSATELIELLSGFITTEVASYLVGTALRLNQVSKRVDKPVDEIVEARKSALDPSDANHSVKFSGLQVVEAIAETTAIKLTARSIDLAYECDNLLQTSRILTDVRPVFSEDAGSIEGAIVAHMLRIRYDSAGTDKELSFALDSADLRRLSYQCDRALLKEKTAQTQMIDKTEKKPKPRSGNKCNE
tara:strand:+ start:556 stop:1209 length:654 start_codon:yes stop_codon:yes gene_type:complete